MDGTTPFASQLARAPAGRHSIEIERLPKTSTSGSQRYRVCHAGAELLASSRDPEFDACRALFALGHTGTLTTFSHGDPTPCMTIGIAHGAAMRTAKEPILGHASPSGGPSNPSTTATRTPQSRKAVCRYDVQRFGGVSRSACTWMPKFRTAVPERW